MTISVIQSKEKLEAALVAENSAALVADLVKSTQIVGPCPVPPAETHLPKNASNPNFVEVKLKFNLSIGRANLL